MVETLKTSRFIHRLIILTSSVMMFFSIIFAGNINIYERALFELKMLEKTKNEINELINKVLNQYYDNSQIFESIRNEYGEYFSQKITVSYKYCCKLEFDDSSTLNEIDRIISNRKFLLFPKVFTPDGQIKLEYFIGQEGRVHKPTYEKNQKIDQLFFDSLSFGQFTSAPQIGLLSGNGYSQFWINGTINEPINIPDFNFNKINEILFNNKIISNNSDNSVVLINCKNIWELIGQYSLLDAKKILLSKSLEFKAINNNKIAFYGLTLDGFAVLIGGPFVGVCLMLYLLSHLYHIDKIKYQYRSIISTFPWVGIFDNIFGILITIFTIVVFPVVGSIAVLINSFDINYIILGVILVLIILQIMIGIMCYYKLIKIRKFANTHDK